MSNLFAPPPRGPGITRVISGGQTGSDRGGLDAALDLGVEIGGWCPKGRKAEDGRVPDHYPLVETDSSGYADRTRRNVWLADATIVFTLDRKPERGSALTIKFAQNAKKPWLHVPYCFDTPTEARAIVFWLTEGWGREQHGGPIKCLNVAGNRESVAPGIGERVRAIVKAVLIEVRRLRP